MFKLILASKSKVRKEILDKNNIFTQVQPSSIDEDPIKQSLLNEKVRRYTYQTATAYAVHRNPTACGDVGDSAQKSALIH